VTEKRVRRPLAVAALALAVGAGLWAAVALPACHKETVTAPTLSATCAAQPASGNAPLPVAFTLTVAGASGSFAVAVSYGDGASGSNPDEVHTYTAAGIYTAAFTVTTASQSARCSSTVTVGSAAPTPVANRPPNAVFKTTPEAVGSRIDGKAPLTMRFNMCATTDPDGDALYFLMDFDGDGKFDSGGITGASCRQDHTYAAGTWVPQMCVHDIGPDRVALHDDQCRTYVVVVTP
jgi:PKD repeat protein